MTAFSGLARFYDAVYAAKDYAAEAGYVARRVGPGGAQDLSFLELGSGTGRLAMELAVNGHRVTGIDASSEMIELANQRRTRRKEARQVEFRVADATSFRVDARFDAVIACFHVLNYMASQAALVAAFRTAAAHLDPGGHFLFDSWHGPAVRDQGPEIRVRDLDVDGARVVRIAEPTHDPTDQTVVVRYRYFIQSVGESWGLLEEFHRLRYLFRTDVAAACSETGFELVQDEEWLTGAPLDETTWSACYVARKTG